MTGREEKHSGVGCEPVLKNIGLSNCLCSINEEVGATGSRKDRTIIRGDIGKSDTCVIIQAGKGISRCSGYITKGCVGDGRITEDAQLD